MTQEDVSVRFPNSLHELSRQPTPWISGFHEGKTPHSNAEFGLSSVSARASKIGMDTLYELAADRPVLAGVAVLTVTWYVLVVLRERAGEKSIGGSSSVRDEEGIRRARERQQELLAQAASGRAAAPVTPPAPVAAAATSDMPARMQASMARKATAAAPPPPPPAPAASKKDPANKNSYTQRLARLQQGKGSTNHNPLQGPSSSGSGAKFCSKKKGG